MRPALWITAIGVICLAGCKRLPSFQFEEQPRAIAPGGTESLWDPQLDVSTSGTLYVLAMYENEGRPRLGFTMSHDGGDTFMPIIPVSVTGAAVTSHGEASPRLANSGTALYALWREPEEGGVSRLLVGRSLSYGHSFEKPVEITAQESFVSFASLAALSTNDVFAVWLDGRDAKPGSDTFSVYSAKSADQGATFQPNVRVATGACPCCRPSVAAGPNRKIFVIWRKVFANDVRDMVVSISNDGGASFSEPVRVAEDGWEIHGCPDSGPSATFTNGRLFVAWLTEGRDEKPRIRLAWSDDEGPFVQDRDISGSVLDPNHPVLKVSSEGKLIAIFQGRSANGKTSNWSQTQAYLVEIDANGAALPPVPVSAARSGSYPTIAAGTGGRLFAAWAWAQDGNESIWLSRGRRQ